MTDENPGPIVLFDGTCGMCDAAVRTIIRFDSRKRFRFAPLDSDFSHTLLERHGLDQSGIDSVVLVDGKNAYLRSTAALLIAVEMDAPWPLLGLLGHLPIGLRDQAYDWIARNRKKWFKADHCPMPTAEMKARFVA